MDGYSLSRQWFDFAFENPEKITPTHGMIYFFAIEQWNRFGQKEKFGFPSYFCMSAIGVKSKNTFYNCFNDLVEFGFIKIITKSQNQNTANIISLAQKISQHEDSTRTALDTANIQQISQHEDSGGTIDKQINKETKKQYIPRKKDDKISKEVDKEKEILLAEIEKVLSIWNERLNTKQELTENLKDEWIKFRKKNKDKDRIKKVLSFYLGKKMEDKYRLSLLSFLKQSNGFVKYESETDFSDIIGNDEPEESYGDYLNRIKNQNNS